MNLSDEEVERYARHLVLPLVGGVGQRTLKAARVAVIGAGGVGSGAIPSLAGAGIGTLTIIDCDCVDRSNLHRQTLFEDKDVGERKARLAEEFVTKRNSFVQTQALDIQITRANAHALLAAHDLVLDGSDNFATRLCVSDACVALHIPLVSAAGMQFQGQVGLFKQKPCYRCFVGNAFDAEDCDTCAEHGVLGALTQTIGAYAALLAINSLVGIGPDQSGKVQLFDGENLSWRPITIPADPRCSACGSV